MDQDFNRLIADVCNIFKDVTAADARPEKEAAAIVFWAKRGWTLRDFRMFLEYEWNREDRRNFYISNGRLAARHFLQTSEKTIPIIEDRIEGLRQIDQVKKKIEERKNAKHPNDDGGMKERFFCCKCGEKIVQRYMKFPDDHGPGVHWQWVNRDDYEAHYDKALWDGLKCMWPEEFKKKYYNEEYLQMLRNSKTDPLIFYKILAKANYV